MGRWSRHPMGSDGALDAKDCLFREFEDSIKENYSEEDLDHVDIFYFDYPFECGEYLKELTVEDLERLCENEYLGLDRFVIPYAFQQFGATPKDENVKQFLLKCFDYHDDITGEWNYCGETDENGEIIELKHMRIFKENFDAVLNGEFDLPEDEGLFAAFFKNLENNGIINKE